MSGRFTYSRWDGTQVGFELDADSVLEEITDDLLYHGDLNAALRRMMQSGFQDRNGERLQGLREMLEQLRRKRRDTLEQHDLGGVYDDIAQELRDIVEQERGALDDLDREDVRVVGISVDPKNDTRKRAASFLLKQGMTGRMEFLMGTREELAPVWKAFAIQPQDDELEHSAHTLLADATGMQRLGFPFDYLTQEALAHDLGRL
jgi:hypothetical protein